MLQSTWISAASEKQRRGRAGRCQPGVAFHLYSRSRAAQLSPFQLPELQRTNLDELCLQVTAVCICYVVFAFLKGFAFLQRRDRGCNCLQIVATHHTSNPKQA